MKRIAHIKGEVRTFREDINGPFRAEISVESLSELRALKRNGKLIAVRMKDEKTGGKNLVPWKEIEDVDWDKL